MIKNLKKIAGLKNRLKFYFMTKFSEEDVFVPLTADVANGNEKLVGVTDGGSPTNISMTLDEIKAYSSSLPYTEAAFLLNQTGTADPVVTEVNNNTGKTFTGAYNSAGSYNLLPNTNFANANFVFPSIQNDNATIAHTIKVASVASLSVTSSQAGTLTNGILINTRVVIRIYVP